jgi:hypothetical protein
MFSLSRFEFVGVARTMATTSFLFMLCHCLPFLLAPKIEMADNQLIPVFIE